MQDKLFRKVLVLTIIVLFAGANVTPSISGKSLKIEEETASQVEPRLILLSKLYGVDTYGSHFNPDENYGSSENIRIANEYGADGSSGWEDVAYIMFGLDWLTPYDNIAYAKLSFYYYDYENTDPGGRDLNIYRVTNFGIIVY